MMKLPFLVLAFAIAVGAGPATADENDLRAQGARPSPGETFSGSLLLAARAVALPEGEWTVVARVAEPGSVGVLVLAKADGALLEGLIWLRSSEEQGRRLSTWCAGGELRQHYQPLDVADGLQGCSWVRQWSTRVPAEDLGRYWWRAFERLEERGVRIPIGLIAAGYYVTDRAPAITVEYSFDAEEPSTGEVAAWAPEWQDVVLTAFRAEPKAEPAPAWPRRQVRSRLRVVVAHVAGGTRKGQQCSDVSDRRPPDEAMTSRRLRSAGALLKKGLSGDD